MILSQTLPGVQKTKSSTPAAGTNKFIAIALNRNRSGCRISILECNLVCKKFHEEKSIITINHYHSK